MATAISANKAELLAIANSVASEKMIDKGIVIEAIEEAIQRAARARYGAENDIRAKLDPDSGEELDDLEEKDSCWGFYGDDWKTNGIKDSVQTFLDKGYEIVEE